MTTITIELPDELAEEARSQGLLGVRVVEAMIRDVLRRRAHYDASSDLPDGFVMEQLAALP